MTEICVLCGKPISDGETVINNHSWWYHYKCWAKCRPYNCPPTAPFTYQGEPMESATKPAPLEAPIRAMCQRMADFLVEKNRAYGNSASEPCRIFAKRVDPLAQIDCRIDDKLSRLMKGCEFPGDNDVKDLAGYLILRMIVEEQQKQDGAK